jgi:gas vesicle protein
MSHDNNSGKSFIVGLLAGGAIGALIALLFAPKSGRELRADLKLKGEEYLDEAEKYMSEAREKAKELINEGKKRSEKIISEAKSKSQELIKDAEKIINEAKEKTSEVISHTKEKIETESGRISSAFKAGVDAYKESKSQS